MILGDPSKVKWTSLDYKLAKAYELRQTYGQYPPWIDRSDRVAFDVKTFTSKSSAAVERKQHSDDNRKGNSKPQFGRRYYAVPRTTDGGPMPTMLEFYEEQRRLSGG